MCCLVCANALQPCGRIRYRTRTVRLRVLGVARTFILVRCHIPDKYVRSAADASFTLHSDLERRAVTSYWMHDIRVALNVGCCRSLIHWHDRVFGITTTMIVSVLLLRLVLVFAPVIVAMISVCMRHQINRSVRCSRSIVRNI